MQLKLQKHPNEVTLCLNVQKCSPWYGVHICTFFSATIDGRNLIFGHKLHIGSPYRGKRFWTHQIPTSCLPKRRGIIRELMLTVHLVGSGGGVRLEVSLMIGSVGGVKIEVSLISSGGDVLLFLEFCWLDFVFHLFFISMYLHQCWVLVHYNCITCTFIFTTLPYFVTVWKQDLNFQWQMFLSFCVQCIALSEVDHDLKDLGFYYKKSLKIL